MCAAVMTEFNAPLSVEEVTPAPVGPHQALVRIAASGLAAIGRREVIRSVIVT